MLARVDALAASRDLNFQGGPVYNFWPMYTGAPRMPVQVHQR
jgi:hypothetical protein